MKQEDDQVDTKSYRPLILALILTNPEPSDWLTLIGSKSIAYRITNTHDDNHNGMSMISLLAS